MTDLSPQAEPALRLAARVARDAGAALHVVHAMGIVGLTLKEALEPLSAGLIPRAQAALEEQVRRAVPAVAGPASCVLDFQDLPHVLATRREQDALDLVVVGDHRSDLGPASRLAVAAELGPAAAVPVLVPSRDTRWPPEWAQASSRDGDASALVAWLNRLVPLAILDAPGGSLPGSAREPAGGEPDLVAVQADEAESIRRRLEQAGASARLEGASVLWVPEADAAVGVSDSGGCVSASPAAVEA